MTQKRTSSIDLTSIEMEDMVSPAPKYTSALYSHDVATVPQYTDFTATPKSGVSNNPYHQPMRHEPPIPTPQPRDKIPLEAGEEVQVKPDYQDSNHPHFARPTGPDFPMALPARSRMPRKHILVPWVLFIIFFLTTAWYTSILLGARFLSIVRPLPSTPAAQAINIYINGELVQGTVALPTRSFAAPTDTVTSILQAPSPTKSLPGSNDGIPDIGNDLGRVSTDVGSRIVSAPTGFVTSTRIP
ncbi:hypothetical protein DDE82_002395 [Stemphylium lycopersici]|nr:hypothetical protein DDE82_002395 [Stemphylium lycopersici]